MTTTRGALRKTAPGYSGGGFIDGLKRAVGIGDSPELKAYKAKAAAERDAKKAAPSAPAPTPAPTQAAPMGDQTIIDKRMAAAGAYRGAKVTGDMAKDARSGGMIKGPGTPTSDSIPAKVMDTGEPIRVATGERIVSAKQDAFLEKIAMDMGFKTVDAMFEAGTGEPVGPTVQYGKGERGAAGGAAPDDLKKKVVEQTPTGGALDAIDRVNGLAKQTQLAGGQMPTLAQIGAASAPSNTATATATGSGQGAQTASPNPPAGTTVTTPTPQATPGDGQMPYGQQMRNLGSALASVPATALKTLVSAPGYGFSAPSSAPVTAAAPTPQAPAAAAQPAGALKPYSPAADSQSANPQPSFQATPSADANAPARLNGVEGKSVGYGATRFDQPGKSPLFTNRTDAAGLADNASLTARPQMTAQNQGAMGGIQARQDAGDQASRNKTQYDAEVAGAKAINDGQARAQLEQAALDGNKAALQILSSNTTDATTRRAQDITAKGQEVQAGALRQSNQFNQKLALDKFGIEQSQEARTAAKAGIEAKQQDRLQAAFDAYDKEPTEANAAKVRVYTGKEKAAAPSRFAHAPGGQMLVDGQLVTQPGYVYDQATGQQVQQQAQQAKAPPPAKALEMLKADPRLAAEFDAKYGQGASAQFLAKK